MTFFLILAALLAAFALYVRLAPSDMARWHVASDIAVDVRLPGGVKRCVALPEEGLRALHDIALTTPRTTVLAGSPDEGMITYVTRSAGFGFPDYTTVWVSEDRLCFHARLRFGRSDFGVNAARVKAWVDALTTQRRFTQG